MRTLCEIVPPSGAVSWFLDKTGETQPRLNLTLLDEAGNSCILVAAMWVLFYKL
jgi:hypothetical protein